MAKNQPGDNTPRMRVFEATSFGDPKRNPTVYGIAGELTKLYPTDALACRYISTLISRFNNEEFALGRLLVAYNREGGSIYRKMLYLLRADYIKKVKDQKLPYDLESHVLNFIVTRIKERIRWAKEHNYV